MIRMAARIHPIIKLRPYLSIIVAGIGCELIYLFYFVYNFSVLQYGHSLQLVDLGAITHNSHTGFILFVLAFSVLFMLVSMAWWDARQQPSTNRGALIIILGFGALFAFTMVFCYPITAIDVFAYIVQSHVLIMHHANPLVIPATTFARDPLMALAGQWGSIGAPYGPLGVLIDAFPTLLAGGDIFWNLILLKCLFALTLVGCGWLVYAVVSAYAPKWALAALVLFAWNPILLFEYSANSHNDVAMMFFVLLAFFAIKKEYPVLAFACILASVSTKYATVLLLPLFFCYGIVHQSAHKERLRYLLKIILVVLLFIAVLYVPFWGGPHTFDSVLSHDSWFQSSFGVLITDIAPLNITGDTAKLIGRAIFACFFLYALLLTRKRLEGLALGSALVMFMFLAFGTVNFESWYAIWAIAVLVLVPGKEASIATLLFSYGTALIAPTFAFLWIWGGRSGDMFSGMNTLTYLLTFVPALLWLFGTQLRRLLEKAQGRYAPVRAVSEEEAAETRPLVPSGPLSN